MSQEQLNAFLQAVKTDPGLQQKLKDVSDVEDVIALAMQAGFDISAEVLQRTARPEHLLRRAELAA